MSKYNIQAPDLAKLLPEIKRPLFAINAEQGVASEFHMRLVALITRFNASLDQEHEVGVRLVSFGSEVVFHLQDMGHWDPFLISFNGITTNGEPVELIQHVNQHSIDEVALIRPHAAKAGVWISRSDAAGQKKS